MTVTTVDPADALAPIASSASVPAPADPLRPLWVKERIVHLSKDAGTRYFENGLLLRELKANNYWRDWGYASFDDCINSLQDEGRLDYGSRNARNFIAMVEMCEALEVPRAELTAIPISKLREIAAVPSEKAQRKLLEQSTDMTVAEVATEARRLKAVARGYASDPLKTVSLVMSESARTAFTEAIAKGREVYHLDAAEPDANVLELILADWFTSIDQILAQETEQEAKTVIGEIVNQETGEILDPPPF